MKYKLSVSHNCGTSYGVAKESDSLEELKKEGEKLDKQKLRWDIQDEDGEQVECCAIHKNIVGFMEVVNKREVGKKERKHKLFVEVEELIRDVQEQLLWWVEARNRAKELMLWALKSSKKRFPDTFELLKDAYEGIEEELKRLKRLRVLQLSVWRVEQDAEITRVNLAQKMLENFPEGV